MDICNQHSEEIVYATVVCPACDQIDELNKEISELNDQIVDLKDEISDLEADL